MPPAARRNRFFDARGQLLNCLPCRQLRFEAQSFARRLIAAGFQPGERSTISRHLAGLLRGLLQRNMPA